MTPALRTLLVMGIALVVGGLVFAWFLPLLLSLRDHEAKLGRVLSIGRMRIRARGLAGIVSVIGIFFLILVTIFSFAHFYSRIAYTLLMFITGVGLFFWLLHRSQGEVPLTERRQLRWWNPLRRYWPLGMRAQLMIGYTVISSFLLLLFTSIFYVFASLLLGGGSRDTANQAQMVIAQAVQIILPLVWLFSISGSFALASRAFRPIRRLTLAAHNISMNTNDLSQRVPLPAARDDVRIMAQTFNEMLDRLDRSFTQQRRFVADASHELRTPVAAIRSMTDVALAQEECFSVQEYAAVLRDVNAEAERLGKLINQLLALARADEGQMRLDCDSVRLDLLTDDVITSCAALAEERGITLRADRLEPATVSGDTARLIQAIMSLVDNALTYTNPGGRVTLAVTTKGGDALLAVTDTGIGIAAKDVPHIFERFYRADPARSRAQGGSGLGLTLVAGIVRVHSGTISVTSTPSQGSSFTICLPLANMNGKNTQG